MQDDLDAKGARDSMIVECKVSVRSWIYHGPSS